MEGAGKKVKAEAQKIAILVVDILIEVGDVETESNVHGPLNLINMLDFWRDEQLDDYLIPRFIRYRAIASFNAGKATERCCIEKPTRHVLDFGVTTGKATS